MSEISYVPFRIAVCFDEQPHSWSETLLETVDSYFCLNGPRAHVISELTAQGSRGATLTDDSSSFLSTVFKVIKVLSYFTLFIPLILGCAKIVLRSMHSFHFIDSNNIKVVPNSTKPAAIPLKPTEVNILKEISDLNPLEPFKAVFEYLGLDYLKEISIADLGVRSIAEQVLVDRLNSKDSAPGCSMKDIGFSEKELVTFLEHKGDKLSSLNLLGYFKKKTDQLIRSLTLCPKLTHLSLKCCKITPEMMRQTVNMPFTHLSSLDLNFTNSASGVVEHLVLLTNLKILNLSNNCLKNNLVPLPISLTSLNLANNCIDEADLSEIGKLNNLTSLNLANNLIGATGLEQIAKLVNLIRLNLESNEIGDEGVSKLFTLMNLTSINLTQNGITKTGATHISKFFKNKLTTLKLGDNFIGREGAVEIGKMEHLRALNLYNNAIGNAGLSGLKGLSKLTSLSIKANNIQDAGLSSISHFTLLTFLHAGGHSNSFTAVGAAELAKINSLETLTFDGSINDLGDTGAASIATLKQLKSLNLHRCKIGNSGMKSLSVLIDLLDLNLSDNQIDDKGTVHLAELKNLKKLDLWANKISNASTEFLTSLVNLTYLNVKGNKINSQVSEIIKNKIPNLELYI